MADRLSLDPNYTGEIYPPSENLPAPPPSGETMVTVRHSIITAQRVAVERSRAKILKEIRELCAFNGQRYLYAWEAKDNVNKRKSSVEGLTIKAANDLARIYGNCIVDVRAVGDGPSHFMFYAVFTDLETGFSMTRAFRQRVTQGIGMRDKDRSEDVVFQIGQSKAIRNVIVNALQTYASEMEELAKKNMLTWVETHKEGADEYINEQLEIRGIDIKRVEAYLGRRRPDWTKYQVARAMAILRTIEDGMISPMDAFPFGDDVSIVEQEKAAKEAGAKQAAIEQGADPETGELPPTAPKQTRRKKEPEAKPEPKPEPAPEARAAPAPEPAPPKQAPPPAEFDDDNDWLGG